MKLYEFKNIKIDLVLTEDIIPEDKLQEIIQSDDIIKLARKKTYEHLLRARRKSKELKTESRKKIARKMILMRERIRKNNKIKLDKEYNFILPKPLTKAFINAISTTAITYGINSFVVLIENIFITANIITHAIASVVSIVITVCVIILFSSFLFLASIKNLNIDSSNVNVINGVINVIIVIIKS